MSASDDATRSARPGPARALALGRLRLAVLFVLGFAVLPAAVRAEESPPDVLVPDEGEGVLVLPAAPSGFERLRTAGADWTFPPHARATVRTLEDLRRVRYRALVDDLGMNAAEPVIVRVARNPDEMRVLAPVGWPPPSYADAVAYPSIGLVLLSLTGRDPAHPPDLETTFMHELSHVALHRAVAGRPVPRWFTEGLAIHHARERSLDRMKLLWEATAQQRLVPLARLEASFADGSADVGVAYAEAADVVAYLLRVDDGTYKMKRLVRELARGRSFEEALLGSYFVSLRELDREWRRDLWDRHSAYPLVVGGTGLWAIATVFLVIAFVKRRRIAKRKLARWAREEAEIDRLEAVVDRKLLEAPAGQPLEVREDRVPTVEHEGRTYTLH
ncbi:MAG: peptidase MA family metallohydrolase [Polyangiales bacterium]